MERNLDTEESQPIAMPAQRGSFPEDERNEPAKRLLWSCQLQLEEGSSFPTPLPRRRRK